MHQNRSARTQIAKNLMNIPASSSVVGSAAEVIVAVGVAVDVWWWVEWFLWCDSNRFDWWWCGCILFELVEFCCDGVGKPAHFFRIKFSSNFCRLSNIIFLFRTKKKHLPEDFVIVSSPFGVVNLRAKN